MASSQETIKNNFFFKPFIAELKFFRFPLFNLNRNYMTHSFKRTLSPLVNLYENVISI